MAAASSLKFVEGPEDVESSRVRRIGFVTVGKRAGVAVELTNGFECFYPGTDLEDYKRLKDADSIGSYHQRFFSHLDYEEIELG